MEIPLHYLTLYLISIFPAIIIQMADIYVILTPYDFVAKLTSSSIIHG